VAGTTGSRRRCVSTPPGHGVAAVMGTGSLASSTVTEVCKARERPDTGPFAAEQLNQSLAACGSRRTIGGKWGGSGRDHHMRPNDHRTPKGVGEGGGIYS
jgi:hypothetical protein